MTERIRLNDGYDHLRDRIQDLEQELATLREALRTVIESAVTDGDRCSICLCDVCAHSAGCPITCAEAVLGEKGTCAQIADKYYAQFIDVAGDIGAEIRALPQEAKK